MKILFTCGGTAGHINPALGVAGRIKELIPQAEILFVGAEGNMETELVPREGFPIETVRISGFNRSLRPKMLLENVKTVWRVAASQRKARSILRQFQPDVAVGTGGYVCYPVLKAAAAMGIPTLVHESNAVPGLTTKLLEKTVSRILVGFEESRNCYRAPEKVEVTGTPVRAGFFRTSRESARRELGFAPDEPIVLAAFGSLGAGHMNGIMEQFIRCMVPEPEFRLIYATGKRYYDEVKKSLSSQGLIAPRIDVREYVYDMPKVMSAADLIVCRAGASTISEVTYLAKPALIVPSPNVVNDHQKKNARVLADAGAAHMLLEGAFDGEDMFRLTREFLNSPEKGAQMSEASGRLGVRDATDRIVSAVLTLAEPENH